MDPAELSLSCGGPRDCPTLARVAGQGAEERAVGFPHPLIENLIQQHPLEEAKATSKLCPRMEGDVNVDQALGSRGPALQRYALKHMPPSLAPNVSSE